MSSNPVVDFGFAVIFSIIGGLVLSGVINALYDCSLPSNAMICLLNNPVWDFIGFIILLGAIFLKLLH